jgi:hypothetical protein
MIRSNFIQQLADFLDTFPPGCSNYHICDMLIRRAERLGMSPPTVVREVTLDTRDSKTGEVDGTFTYNQSIAEWEDEDCGEFGDDWTWEDENEK